MTFTEKKEKLAMELWIEVYTTKISMGVSHAGSVTDANKAVSTFRLEFDI